jgi:hypothetical protein
MNKVTDGYNHPTQQHLREQQEKAMQQAQDKQRAMEQYEKLRHDSYSTQGSVASALPSISPIRAALETLDVRTSNLMGVTERLFEKLRPVTRNTDDNHPSEPCIPREGNSSLTIDINAMADRLRAIEISLELQIDKLEV